MSLQESVLMGRSLDTDFQDYYGLTTEQYNSSGSWVMRQGIIPVDGVLKDLYLALNSAWGSDINLHLRVNGVATALSVTIPAGQTWAEDNAHPISVVAGDRVHLQSNDLAINRKATWNLIFQYGSEKFSLVLGNAYSGVATTRYWVFGQMEDTVLYPTEAEARCLVPRAMTVKGLRVGVSNAGAGVTHTITLLKNGLDTALSVMVVASGTAVSAIEVPFAPFDHIGWKVVTVGNVSSGIVAWGTRVVPAVPDTVEQIICSGSAQFRTVAAAVRYGVLWPASARTVWSATPQTQQLVMKRRMSAHDFHLEFDVPPGAGKSYEFRIQKNNVDTALAVTITGAVDTQGADTTHVIEFEKGDKIGLKVTPSGSPALVYPIWGLVLSRKHPSSISNNNAKLRMMAKV